MTEQPARKLLLLLTVESDTSGPFLNWLLPRLGQARVGSATIDLGPLDLRSTAALAAAMLGISSEHPDVLKLAMESKGLPGALRELVRQRITASSQDEETVLDAVRIADIAGLPLPPRRLLELLAVAGGPVPTEVAVVAAQLGDQAVNAVSTLRAHRLADVSGASADALEVGSRIVMDHVLDRAPEPVRRGHHKALAAALEQGGHTDALVLATHYAGAGDASRAGTVAWLAANRTLEAGKWEQAVPLLELALRHGDWPPRERVAMLATLARTHGLVGHAHEAALVLQSAIDAAPEVSKPTLQRQQAEHFLSCGDVARGLPLLEFLQAGAELAGFSRGILSGGMTAWRRFQQRRRGDAFESKLRTDVDPVELHKVDVAWCCVSVLALNDPEKAWSYQPVHLTTALDVGEVERVMRALCEEVVIQVARELQADRGALARVEELVKSHRSAAGAAYLAAAKARIAWLTGEIVPAIELGADAERQLRRAARPAWLRQPQRLLTLECRLAAGGVDAVSVELDRLARKARNQGNARQLVEVLARLGPTVAAATGQGPALHAALKAPLNTLTAPRPGGLGVIALAQLDLLASEPERAVARMAAAEDQVATAFIDPWLRTSWWRTRGIASRQAGDARAAAACAATLRKDDRPWAAPWADLVEARYDRAAPPLRALGMGLDTALATTHLDDGASATWLASKGVTDLAGIVRTLT